MTPQRSSRHSFVPLAVVAALLTGVLASPWALADDQDTFSITPGISRTHDNNLFRLPGSVDAKAEDITVSSLTLRLNKPYSLQRFELEASYIDYRYKNYSYLSYDATPYKAAWRWSLTPYLHGNLTSDRTMALQSFADYSGFNQRNINTTENTRFDGEFDVSPSWHVLAGVSEYSYKNTQLTQGEGNNQIRRSEFGIRRSFSTGNSLAYVASNGRGEYINRPQPIPGPLYFDNRFDDIKNELRMVWLPTGKTRINANLGYLQRNHANFSSRNYSGAVGSVNFNWSISGKTSLNAILSHDLASYQTFNQNYTVTDRLALMPVWQISGKTALRARYDYARQDYLGAPGLFDTSGRSDILRTGMVAFDWQPLRTATLSATLQNERRASNQPGLDYVDTTATVSAQITF